MKYKFRLTAENDAGHVNAFYCDSVATTLRVWDNTRARLGGVKFTSVEYAPVKPNGKLGRFKEVHIEELREHDIDVIHAIDSRYDGLRGCLWFVIAFTIIAFMVVAWMWAPN